MKDLGKKNLLGLLIDAVDYQAAIEKIICAARHQQGLSVSALAVHGLMTGVLDDVHRYRLNHIDLLTADGQPVRWGLNLLHGTQLQERVYGPQLMLDILDAAERQSFPVFLYGSKPETLQRLEKNLCRSYPALQLAGMEASKFRRTSEEEMQEIAARIRSSGAKITLVGLGCPRQEVFVYEYKDLLGMPVIALGAAFDYHAGLLREPPPWMQRHGLQWLHRLAREPRRLWRRYLFLNPLYLGLLIGQYLQLWRPDPESPSAPDQLTRNG